LRRGRFHPEEHEHPRAGPLLYGKPGVLDCQSSSRPPVNILVEVTTWPLPSPSAPGGSDDVPSVKKSVRLRYRGRLYFAFPSAKVDLCHPSNEPRHNSPCFDSPGPVLPTDAVSCLAPCSGGCRTACGSAGGAPTASRLPTQSGRLSRHSRLGPADLSMKRTSPVVSAGRTAFAG